MDSVVAQAHGPAGGNATAQSPETATVNNNGAILVRAKKFLEFLLFSCCLLYTSDAADDLA